MKTTSKTCPQCTGSNLYTSRVNSGGRYGPILLPGLGGFLRFPKFDVVVCADCGLTRFYAEPQAREKLPRAHQWTRL